MEWIDEHWPAEDAANAEVWIIDAVSLSKLLLAWTLLKEPQRSLRMLLLGAMT
jgi:hypothetical protein